MKLHPFAARSWVLSIILCIFFVKMIFKTADEYHDILQHSAPSVTIGDNNIFLPISVQIWEEKGCCGILYCKYLSNIKNTKKNNSTKSHESHKCVRQYSIHNILLHVHVVTAYSVHVKLNKQQKWRWCV